MGRRTQRRRGNPTATSSGSCPKDPSDLKQGGKLQALQVFGKDGKPITFTDGDVSATSNPPKYVDLHNGASYKTAWIDLVTTTSASVLPGPDANKLARDGKATPFKRPENGVFQPGSGFKKFYFTETGDTNALSPATTSGGFGGIFVLTPGSQVERRLDQGLLQRQPRARRLRQPHVLR